jgi:23S rRNA pseudouridine1911/1915/1917 synthase
MIVYQDEHIVVANKPAGTLSIPDRFDATKISVQGYLTQELGRKIFTVHRLDRETSGILVFAKTEAAHRHLSIQFEKHETEKFYYALLDGVIQEDEGEIDQPLAEHPSVAGKMHISKKGKPSQTQFKIIERFKFFSLVEARILTGRMHQIRVHFKSIGYPLAIDALYGRREALFAHDIKQKGFRTGKFTEEVLPLMSRSTLHAYSLRFRHPQTEESVHFEAELPKDFRALLNQLRKWSAS